MSLTEPEPFHFYTLHNLTYLTGRKAQNLAELLAGIREASKESVYYHTHQFLEQHEFLSPEPPNDFAYWITNVLQDDVLGEQVGGIDLREYHSLEMMQGKIIEVIEYAIQSDPDRAHRNVPAGEEFHFMKAQSFVFPTPYIAHSLVEFRDCLKQVTIFSVYYHMFEAWLRTEQSASDFSIWLRGSLGEEKLAGKIDKLDPYTQPLENLQQNLIRLIEQHILQGSYA